MENAIIDRIKTQAKSLKTFSEELQVQMALGKAEARDLFEKERKNLSNYMNEHRAQVAKSEAENDENRREFLTTVENLESALLDDVPTKVRAYEKYKKGVLEKIYILEEQIRDNYPTMNNDMQEMLDVFKGKMDAFRVNLALHDKDDPEHVQEIKKDLTEKLEDIREVLGKRESEQSRLDNFFEDISESFGYLKRAVDNLSK